MNLYEMKKIAKQQHVQSQPNKLDEAWKRSKFYSLFYFIQVSYRCERDDV